MFFLGCYCICYSLIFSSAVYFFMSLSTWWLVKKFKTFKKRHPGVNPPLPIAPWFDHVYHYIIKLQLSTLLQLIKTVTQKFSVRWGHPAKSSTRLREIFSYFFLFFFSLFIPIIDVDECSGDDVCIQGECLNTDGSFLCLCESGFKFNIDSADCEGKMGLNSELVSSSGGLIMVVVDPQPCPELCSQCVNERVCVSRLIVMLH